jgi:hypothetical protein
MTGIPIALMRFLAARASGQAGVLEKFKVSWCGDACKFAKMDEFANGLISSYLGRRLTTTTAQII